VLNHSSKALLATSVLLLIVNPILAFYALVYTFFSSPIRPSPVGETLLTFGTMLPFIVLLASALVGILGLIFWRKPEKLHICFISAAFLIVCNIILLIIFSFADLSGGMWITVATSLIPMYHVIGAYNLGSENRKRQMRIMGAAMLVLCLLFGASVGIFTRINPNEQLYRAVRNHVREHGESTVTFGELLDFEWEQALYFDYTNPHRIYEGIQVHFTGTDLTRGILFVQDGEIVYYEYFPQRASGWFDIHRVRLAMGGAENLRVFQRDCVLELGIGEDYFGNRLYWMRVRQ